VTPSEGNGFEHAHEETHDLDLPDMMAKSNAEGEHPPTEATER